VREFREKYAARLKHNAEVIFKDICKKQRKSGKVLVELSPRKPRIKNNNALGEKVKM
jgi:hypothetical protein